MIREEDKNHILIWLPVMKELEAMGYNPIKLLFGGKLPKIAEIEASYVAINSAKTKYPEWYKEVSTFVDKQMADMEKNND